MSWRCQSSLFQGFPGGPTSGGGPSGAPSQPPTSAAPAGDDEKAELIVKVLQLTDEQVPIYWIF